MQHVLSTPNRGVVMQPGMYWDGKEAFLFTVDGMSDSGDATEPKSQQRCGGLQVFFKNCPLRKRVRCNTVPH